MPPQEIPDPPPTQETPPAIKPEGAYDEVFNLLLKHHGVDFACYRRTTIERRLERRAKLKDASNPQEYLGKLEEDPG